MFMLRVALSFGGGGWGVAIEARGVALCAVGLVVGGVGDCGSDDCHFSVVQAGAHWPILDT